MSDLSDPPERASRAHGDNPFIAFDADKCILCAKCTRYCDEVEAVSAITLARRGPQTTIATADSRALHDTTCEYCGGCVAVCPTGAMTEAYDTSAATETVRTTCGYCGVGCQLDLRVDPGGNDGRGRVVNVAAPPVGTIPNDGNLCVKGKFAYAYVNHPDRLTEPLIRGEDGELHPASWDDALALCAEKLTGIRQRHGENGLAFISSSRCTGEENYLVQKLARGVFSTNHVHQCAAT
jgi:predicted molibdopterin-dependent oxidoreductase YjgC